MPAFTHSTPRSLARIAAGVAAAGLGLLGYTLIEARCPVLPGDGALEVATRVHALEYAYYPQVIEHVLCGSPLPDQA